MALMNWHVHLLANMKIKVLALLLAILLLLFVALDAEDEIDIPVSVVYRNVPEGVAAKEVSNQTLLLRVAGARILLLRQKIMGVPVIIDLSNGEDGVNRYSGLEKSTLLVKGVRAIAMTPQVTEVVLAPIPAVKSLPEPR